MKLSSFPVLVAAAVSSTLVLAGASAAFAKTVELRNDTLQDNGDATAVCGFVVGEKFAARFTPPAYPARILKIRVLLAAVELSTSQCVPTDVDTQIDMPVEVFHSTSSMPGDSLGSFSGYAYSSDSVLNELDVNAGNLTIDDGSFVVAYTLEQSNASPVHDASNAPVAGANYIYGDLGLGKEWYSFEDLGAAGPRGNWVVRLDVSVPDEPGPDGGTGGTGGDGGSGGSSGDGGSAGSGTGGTGGGNGCTKDADCSGGQTCDTDLGQCVQVSCSVDSDCSGGYVCRTDVCRKVCNAVSDCRGGESCEDSEGVKVCMSASATPAPASSGDDGGCTTSGSGTGAKGALGALALALGLMVSRLSRSARRR